MKNIKLIYLAFALLAMAFNDAAWARGGHGGDHHGGGHHGGGGHHIGGGGHRHADGGHHHSRGGHRHNHLNFGFNLGGYNSGFYGSNFYGPRNYGYGAPFFYPRTYNYSYGSTVIVPSTPPIYIQREEIKPTQPQANYWHYCQNPDGYYPYVKQCPGGWLQVAPQPPAQ